MKKKYSGIDKGLTIMVIKNSQNFFEDLLPNQWATLTNHLINQ